VIVKRNAPAVNALDGTFFEHTPRGTNDQLPSASRNSRAEAARGPRMAARLQEKAGVLFQKQAALLPPRRLRLSQKAPGPSETNGCGTDRVLFLAKKALCPS